MKIAVFAGDGIGPEVTAQALRVLDELSLPGLTLFEGDVGAVAYRRHGQPLPDHRLARRTALCQKKFAYHGRLDREHRGLPSLCRVASLDDLIPSCGTQQP